MLINLSNITPRFRTKSVGLIEDSPSPLVDRVLAICPLASRVLGVNPPVSRVLGVHLSCTPSIRCTGSRSPTRSYTDLMFCIRQSTVPNWSWFNARTRVCARVYVWLSVCPTVYLSVFLRALCIYVYVYVCGRVPVSQPAWPPEFVCTQTDYHFTIFATIPDCITAKRV